jgi:hypothetical protein
MNFGIRVFYSWCGLLGCGNGSGLVRHFVRHFVPPFGPWGLLSCGLCRLFMMLADFGLGDRHRTLSFAAHCIARTTLDACAKPFGDIFIDGAGMRLFFGDAEFGQHVDDGMRRDLELPGELVDSDFTHK